MKEVSKAGRRDGGGRRSVVQSQSFPRRRPHPLSTARQEQPAVGPTLGEGGQLGSLHLLSQGCVVDVWRVGEWDRAPTPRLDHRFVWALLVVLAQLKVAGQPASFWHQGGQIGRCVVRVWAVVQVVEDVEDVHVVDIDVSLRVGRSEDIVGDWPCMVSSSGWSEHGVGPWVVTWPAVSWADPHLVDGKDSTQPLRLDLLKSSRSLSGGRGEGVEGAEEAWLLLHGQWRIGPS